MLVGCWDAFELNELSLVTGIGIDKGKHEKLSVTIELLNAPAIAEEIQSSGQTSSITMTYEGNTLAEVVKKTNQSYTRKLLYSHLRSVIIHSDIAEEGMLQFLEFFESDREVRNDFNIVIVDNASARDVLKVMYPIQKVSSLKLSSQLDTLYSEWGGDPDVRMSDFITALLSPGREPVLAQIKVVGDPEKGNTMENIQKVDLNTYVEIDGLAVFEGMKYLGNIPLSNTRNYLLLQNKLKKTSLTVGCGENLFTTMRVLNAKTTIHAYYKDGIPHFDVNIELEGRMDNTQCEDDFTKIDTYKKYSQLFSKGLKKNIEETIQEAKELGVDYLGFGEHMERQAYQQFKKRKKNWNAEFLKAEIDLNINIYLRRTGLTKKPFVAEIDEDENE